MTRRKRSAYEFRRERDEDLLSVYRSLLAQRREVNVTEVMEALASHPASRFWVSEERAIGVTARLLRGETPRLSRNKLAMFREIAKRTRSLMAGGVMSLRRAVARVIEEPAPCFYITPKSARMLVSRARKRRREARKDT